MIVELLNHLWQSTVFALLCALLAGLLRNDGAHVRYWLWTAASLKFLVPFAALSAVGAQLTGAASRPEFLATWSSTLAVVARPLSAAPQGLQLAAQVALGIWLCGTLLLLARWLVHALELAREARESGPIRLDGIALPDGLEVRQTTRATEPALVGILAPVLMLPRGLEAALTPSQLASVVAHEVAHWQRRDNLSAAAQILVEALFWPHPLVWWIGARLVEERERACDERVIESGHARGDYAEAVLRVCEICIAPPLRIGVGGGSLKRRIVGIMRSQPMRKLNLRKKGLLGLAGAATIVVPVLAGMLWQPAAAQPDSEFQPVAKTPPVYPAEAAAAALEGYVVVEYVVTAAGTTRDVVAVESSSPLFEPSAVESARQYVYEPRIVDGEPVDVAGVRTMIRFELAR